MDLVSYAQPTVRHLLANIMLSSCLRHAYFISQNFIEQDLLLPREKPCHYIVSSLEVNW